MMRRLIVRENGEEQKGQEEKDRKKCKEKLMCLLYRKQKIKKTGEEEKSEKRTVSQKTGEEKYRQTLICLQRLKKNDGEKVKKRRYRRTGREDTGRRECSIYTTRPKIDKEKPDSNRSTL